MTENNKSYGLFLGCLMPTEQYGYEMSVREVFPKLGIELLDIEGASCCGAPMRNINLNLTLYLSARNLALAERMGIDILAPCPNCHLALSEVKRELAGNPQLAEKINGMLAEEQEGLTYSGKVNILHPIDVLHDVIGLEKLKELATTPLSETEFAAHYGCHLVRPHKTGRPDDSENPQKIEKILEAIGAKSREYPEKLNCCGAAVLGHEADSALSKTGLKLKAIQDHGFKGLVTVCPWGHKMFDSNQKDAGQTIGETLSMPVLYLTQLVGIAIGLDQKKLGVELNQSPINELEFIKAEE